MRNTLAWSILSVIIAGTPASAQVTTPPRSPWLATCGRDSTGLGRISGQLIADSAGIKLSRGINVKNACLAQSSATGAYTVRGLPPGDYMVSVGDLGVDYIEAVKVHIYAESTSVVDFHLKPENRVAECLAVVECAAWLKPSPTSVTGGMSDLERVREAAYRTVIAMVRRPAALWRNPQTPIVYCLASEQYDHSADSSMISAVRHSVPTARALGSCQRQGAGRGVVVRTVTNEPALIILVMAVTVNSDLATATGSGNGTRWACTFKRTSAGWQATACRTTGVS